MILIRHRRNTPAELAATPAEWGVEVDIRSRGPDLIIHHDPFQDGELFEAWLEVYRHRFLILNVKEEGLEDRLLALMAARGIEDFFFLDQSFPFLVRTANRGESRCAVRVSEFETVDTALSLAGRIDWVWVDCFTRFPLEATDARRLKAAGFKLCLVSPELQGRDAEAEIEAMRRTIDGLGIAFDAVCSKTPERWL
ncbi:MAG: phosphatidylinositol-specific phospholipase C/glycerophosphodiester phosphodiesterase family protein [Alphaproteobacteria bacterium]|jgi:hypothetical protein|nr:phosphatidylinositol-specific phospholipase C/glycerophosphodiester phosphodiesterase family protein [Alphaproteobacteria bacterium]